MRAAATPVELLGREAELQGVDAWLESLAERPAALLVTGEPGIGKTTVWNAAVGAARGAGALVLVCRTVESELPLGYAGLGDLLGDVAPPLLEHVPEPLAAALRAALLLQDGDEPAEPLGVGRGTLAVLRALAERSPVVVAVDDVQWLDGATARALAFAVRRLEDAPVGLLASLRTGHEDPLDLRRAVPERVAELPLGGLSAGATGHLVRARVDASLSRRVVARLHERSGGNPFFALELARAAGEALPSTLRELVDARLARLPADAAAAVELAAVTAPAATARFDVDGLDAAVLAGVLVEQDGAVRFSHPLLAAGAYERVPPGRRRELHRLAAELADGLEERARHVALAAAGPDEAAARLLEDAARAARARGAPETAAELASRARALTPPGDGAARARRTIDEADYLFLAADEPGARELVEELLAGGATGSVRVRALMHRALFASGPEAAVAALEEAVHEPHDDPILAARALAQLAWQRACWLGHVEEALPEAAEAVGLAERLGDEPTLITALTTSGLIKALAGEPGGEADYRRASAVCDRVGLGPADRAPRSAFAHERWWRGAWDEAERLLAAEREEAERSGDEWLLMRLGIFEADFAWYRGAWDEAERLLDAALDDAQDYWRVVVLGKRALLRGRRGDPSARLAAEEILASPVGAADPVLRATAEHALGLLELAAGRPAEAADLLTRLTATLDHAGARRPDVESTIPETVAALVEAGRRDEADRLARALERRAERLPDARSVPAAALCRGLVLLADGRTDAALERLAVARRGFEAIGVRWELARTLLAEGRSLRRAGRRTEAAAALERAAGLFGELRAEPWRTQALDELRRARPRPRRDDSLTAAESRVAALVAAGRTNKQVAAELFLTVATVEAHLTRIYRKLGLRSRTELARAVADGTLELDA